ncbi:MAG: hypothetical protein ACE5E5_00070 [Phycisphaerae bacterium]
MRCARCGAFLALPAVLVLAGLLGMNRLEAHVLARLADRASPTVIFPNLPESLASLARPDLDASVSDLLKEDWTDHTMCKRIADRVGSLAWVADIKHVRRRSNGSFEVLARFRVPFAMIRSETGFCLVGADAVRLPGLYRYDPDRPLIQGVAGPPPEPGQVWPGEDIKAGISVIGRLAQEPYRHQITAVLVDNHRGRVDPRSSHIALATDVAGGRILWGSEPGEEVEENSVARKLAMLRTNYRETGRADANHTVIDISTFPDRFVVPN